AGRRQGRLRFPAAPNHKSPSPRSAGERVGADESPRKLQWLPPTSTVGVDLNAVLVALVSLDDRMIAFASGCLQPPVTLAPVRRGEGRGEGSVDESEAPHFTGRPPHPSPP